MQMSVVGGLPTDINSPHSKGAFALAAPNFITSKTETAGLFLISAASLAAIFMRQSDPLPLSPGFTRLGVKSLLIGAFWRILDVYWS
jgi:hypothetical protein